MKWLEYSNKVSPKVIFLTALVLWFVPFAKADLLVFWYAYKETKKDNLIKRYRRFLPKKMIKEFLGSKLVMSKWIQNEEQGINY